MTRATGALLGVILAVLGGVEAAAEGPLRELTTSDDGKGWEAVGRLNIGTGGYCTGALIAPNLVLTAAHCLYQSHTGEPVPLNELEFLAGWRNGRAEAYRRVRRAAVHPDYVFTGIDRLERVAFDVAVLELEQPIRNASIRPFSTSTQTDAGTKVGVVSYATGRDEAPSLEEVCEILSRRNQVLMLSCDIDYGASGAPIFVVENGEARIVSVVAAKAQIMSRRVALAAELEGSIELVKGLLASADGVFRRTPEASTLPTVRPSERGEGGAKFVRP